MDVTGGFSVRKNQQALVYSRKSESLQPAPKSQINASLPTESKASTRTQLPKFLQLKRPPFTLKESAEEVKNETTQPEASKLERAKEIRLDTPKVSIETPKAKTALDYYREEVERYNELAEANKEYPSLLNDYHQELTKSLEEMVAKGTLDTKSLPKEPKKPKPLPVGGMYPPPAATLEETIDIWSEMRRAQGKLLTHTSQTDPKVKAQQTLVNNLVNRVAGELLREQGKDVAVTLYSSPTTNAFAAHHEIEWHQNPEWPQILSGKVNRRATLPTLRKEWLPQCQKNSFYELGFHQGSLKNAKTEGELAFLAGHESAHLLEGHVQFDNIVSAWLSSQANEVVADCMGMDMAFRAGYNPADGLSFLERIHRTTEAPADQLETILKGATAGASSHHHEGVRIAVAQLKLEQLRQTEEKAHPALFPTQEAIESTTSKESAIPTNGLLEALPEANELFLKDGYFKLYDAIAQNKPDAAQRGEALMASLELLEKRGVDDQTFMEASFQLFDELSYTNMDSDRVCPELSDPQCRRLHELYENRKWEPKKALERKPKKGLNHLVCAAMLAPSFQKVVAPLYGSDTGLTSLVDQFSSLITPEDKSLGRHEKAEQLMQVLGGQSLDTSSLSGWYFKFPRGSAISEGELAPVYRKKLLQNLAEFPIKEALLRDDKFDEKMVPAFLRTARKIEGQFGQELRQTLKPMETAFQGARDRELATYLKEGRFPRFAWDLNWTTQEVPLSRETRAKLKESLVSALPGAELDRFHSGLGVVKALTKFHPEVDKASQKRIETLILSGILGHPSLGKKLPLENALIKQVISEKGHEGLLKWGSQVPADQTPGPLCILDKHPDLCPKPSLEQIKTYQELWGLRQPPREARRYLLSSFSEQSSQVETLKEWNEIVEPLLKSSNIRTLDGSPELRKKLATELQSRIESLPPEERQKQLEAESAKLLTHNQTAEVLVGALGRDLSGQSLYEAVSQVEKANQLNSRPAVRKAFRNRLAETYNLQPNELKKVWPEDKISLTDQASGFSDEVRGLSAFVAAARTRNAEEQLQTVEYVMGRRAEAPQYLKDIHQELPSLLDDARESLEDASIEQRTAVAASFLAGPSGLLKQESGRQFLISKLLEKVSPERQEIAHTLAEALLDSHQESDSLAVGYLLAQPADENGELGEAKMLNALFDSFGAPGIKLKQYLAFTSEFEEFKDIFNESQDQALPPSYLEAVKLADHHFGEDWPSHWRLEGLKGSGSVNVALRYFDEEAQEHRILSLPRKGVKTKANYDFYRLQKFLDRLCNTPENENRFGHLKGLATVIKESVNLEFDRQAAFEIQNKVQGRYDAEIDGWKVQSIPAYGRKGGAIWMAEAPGETARKVLEKDPSEYKSAMASLGQVEQDILYGIEESNHPQPKPTHANPDVHDGQALIDSENKIVTLLDFGQAVDLSNEEREYAADLLGVIGGAHTAQEALQVLSRNGVDGLTNSDLEPVLARQDSMDSFIRLLGLLVNKGHPVPLGAVHWVMAVNRQRALGKKTDKPIEKDLKKLVATRLRGGDMKAFNTLRVFQRAPWQATKSGLLFPAAGWMLRVAQEGLSRNRHP